MNLTPRLSCRSNFTDPREFGPHICTRGAETQYTCSYADTPDSSILIHGYRNDEQSAERSYRVIEGHMPEQIFTEYYWPGGDRNISFPFAVPRARLTGHRLRDALNGFRHRASIDINGHSLGCLPPLEALKYGADVQIRHLLLLAAAVDYRSLEPDGEFGGALNNVESVNVFFSGRDNVLRHGFPIGSFGDKALGLVGPKTLRPRVRAFDCTAVVDSHGGYKNCPQFYAAWRSIRDGSAAPGLTILQ